MTNPQHEIHTLLRHYHIRPDKRKGQHFLFDPTALNKVITAADLVDNEVVLEVGPGLGNLTRLLAVRVKRVVAVEIDPNLFPILKDSTAKCNNVDLVLGDILNTNINQLFADSNYIVVSNIPYNITSALIRLLLETPNPPKKLVLTIQKEVAERICASPGKMSILALSVQVYGRPAIKARIPASAFYPSPKVDSAVIRVDRYPEPHVPITLLPVFFRLIKAGFSQKRKTISNSLRGGMHWSEDQTKSILINAGIEPTRRAQTLSIEEWASIAKLIDSSQEFRD